MIISSLILQYLCHCCVTEEGVHNEPGCTPGPSQTVLPNKSLPLSSNAFGLALFDFIGIVKEVHFFFKISTKTKQNLFCLIEDLKE